MAALGSVLANNPQPLLEFATLKDFSGENIGFLSHVSNWKRTYSLSRNTSRCRHRLFLGAVLIYSHFVSLEYSDFPINLSSKALMDLNHLFEEAADSLNHRKSRQFDPVAPFADTLPSSSFSKTNLNYVTQMAELDCSGHLDIPVSDKFRDEVFDEAVKEIKYLVLTNTWPKFEHTFFEDIHQLGKRRHENHMFNILRKYLRGIEGIV
jgi:hypothetical protein